MTDSSFGPYRVVCQVAAGGMGVVQRAVDPRDGSEVAIKTPAHPAVARALRRAIAEVQLRGIVHRDVRPESVQLTDTGRLVLLDFGLARDARGLDEPDEPASARTLRTGHAGYTAPEILAGASGHATSDWFAFGALALELWTGARAFAGVTPEATRARVRTLDPLDEPRARAALPRDLAPLVAACLKKDPEERERALATVGIPLVPPKENAA